MSIKTQKCSVFKGTSRSFLQGLLDKEICFSQSLSPATLLTPGRKGVTLPSSASSVEGGGVCCFSKQDVLFSSADNVTLQIDGVLYLRVMDPYKVLSLLCRCSAQVKLAASVAAPSTACACRATQPAASTAPQAPLTWLCWLPAPHNAHFGLCSACYALRGGWAEHPNPFQGFGSAFLWQGCLWQVSHLGVVLAQPALFEVPLSTAIDSVFCFCSPGQLWGGRS